MVETTNTSYIVSSKDRSKTELVIAEADLRMAHQGDSAAQLRIIRAYDAQSTYVPTDDLFAAIGEPPQITWRELNLVPARTPSAARTQELAQSAADARTVVRRTDCDCSCSTCEGSDYHCHHEGRDCFK